MSTAAPENAARTELDVVKLHTLPSEQQELYLLTYTSDLVQYVSELSNADVKAQQASLKKELFKIISLSSPMITRVLRTNLGKCFGAILAKGDRGILFDTISDLLAITNAGKSTDLKNKFAAAHCLGEVFGVAGDSAIGQSSVVVSSFLKLLKASNNHTGFRGAIFSALRKVIIGVGESLDEPTTRDIWKQARNAVTSDKSTFVQVNACRCMEQLIKYTGYLDNISDFDVLKTVVWRSLESPIASVRHATAACLAQALVKNFDSTQQTSSTKTKKQKRKSKKPVGSADGDEIDVDEDIGTGGVKKPDSGLSFTLSDLLKQLSTQYVKSSTSNRLRAGIAVCYKFIMRNLGEHIVEAHYGEIVHHFCVHLLNHPIITYNRFRLVMTRKFVKIILEDTVGRESLRENSQLLAAQFLVNGILKDYPQVIQERREPSKHTLSSVLSALTSLILSLGSAVTSIGDTCREALLQVLPHPSYTVQIHAAKCLRQFVLACPSQLLSCVTICLNSLNREIGQLSTPRHSPRRCLGFANGLSAMLSTSRLQPLYGSVEVFSRVLSQATDLLKTSSSSELRVASTQIQVAWVLIGGLMPLGPSFVKIHLSQLMLLWKNALPKPLGKENTAQRGTLETSFLAHVRECALGSMLAFLQFNGKLITVDGSRRLATMLQNTIAFLDGLPRHKSSEDISERLFPSLQLNDYSLMVRRRVLQCFSKLVNLHHTGHNEIISQSSLLSLAISSFADPDSIQANPMESSIAAAAGQFESLWELSDNIGFGVTGLARVYVSETLTGKRGENSRSWLAADSTTQEIDDTVTFPVIEAPEHDSVLLYCAVDKTSEAMADPPATELVNSAIELFALALPLQTSKVQESSVEQIATLLSSNSLQRNPGRKAAMTVNVAIALLHALRVANKEMGLLSLPVHIHAAAEKILQELVQKFVVDIDPAIRTIGFESLGRLCSCVGNTFTNSQIKWLVDTVVANREPHARAGCAAALGCIHSTVGGMAAGFHLKTIVGVLLSLCNDPHPVVHFWALDGLDRVAESAGLTFSAYVSSSLGMLAQLYIADTHNEEAWALATSNIELIYPAPVVITRCVDSLINVLGPDLQDIAKTRNLILTLVRQFQLEENPAMITQSSRCLDHLSLFAPSYVDYGAYVKRLQKELSSTSSLMRDAAILGLSNLMKRDAELVVATATPALEDELWLVFDDSPDNVSLRKMIQNWLEQTALTHTGLWIQRCQNVLSKTRTKSDDAKSKQPDQIASASHDIADDEVAGFANAIVGAGQEEAVENTASGQELLKWQTRSFVMLCLSDLLTIVGDQILPDQTIPAEAALQQKVGEIVRVAFSASTANVIELRIWGLKILDQVLKMFGKTPDPDFVEASLLEQYQAQFGSALTPAFATDSSPELATQAINVCATFVAAGIVTNVERMGRIFKLLVVGLEKFSKNPNTTEIGDLKGLNANARVMVKMALYSAWARLQMASAEQEYLVKVVQPYTAMLTPLWLSSLQEYARLRFEPDISGSLGTPQSGDLHEVYAALNRDTLLKFYQDSWLNLVDAIASLVEKDSDFVFDALDNRLTEKQGDEDEEEEEEKEEKEGKLVNGGEALESKGMDINYRDEPVAFFFVLFGLTFEALVDESITSVQRSEILQALKKIMRPAVSGNAVYQDAVFSETMEALHRLVLTEGKNIQTVIVETARNLALDHPSIKAGRDRSDNLSEDIEQLFELTRSVILALASLLPNLSDSTSHLRFNTPSDELLDLIQLALSSLVDIAAVFPSIIRHDLYSCILHIFNTLLATGVCQAEIVPQALPIFRRFILGMTANDASSGVVSRQLRGCLTRLLTTLSIAQRRESESSLICAKNTLLAMTIVITTARQSLSPQDPVILRVLNEFLDCLQDVGLASVAAGCIRSVLLLYSPRCLTDEVIARHLIPRLISYIAGIPSEINGEIPNDPEHTRSLLTQTLVSFITNPAITPCQNLPTALPIIVSALLVRAKREAEIEAESDETPKIYAEIASRLVEIVAKTDHTLFKMLVATRLSDEQKTLLEKILRASNSGADADRVKGGLESETGQKSAPSIALRMDF